MILIVMGVTGSGKTTVGATLARMEGWQYAEGDDYHSSANKAKMHAGIPLTDEDRAPWLASLHEVLLGWNSNGTNGVLTCSALKLAYRNQLSQGIPSTKLRFLLLQVPKAVLVARLAARKGHYMNPDLLDSQLATLEMPQDAIRVDGTQPVETIVAQVISLLGAPGSTESHP